MALLIGITLASTFFAGIDIKTNATVKEALDQQLNRIPVDMTTDVSSLASAPMLSVKDNVSHVEGVADTEIVSGAWEIIKPLNPNSTTQDANARIAGISANSHVYNGWLNRPAEAMGENETYISSDAPIAGEVETGDTVSIVFSISRPYYAQPTVATLNLTVKGFAQLDDKAYAVASGSYYYTSYYYYPPEDLKNRANVLLVDWESTMRRLVDAFRLIPDASSPIGSSVLIYVDRESLIAPWDMSTSVVNVKELGARIQSALDSASYSRLYVQDNLQETLNRFQYVSIQTSLSLAVTSLPIFFVAWYMGTTVSDVSFNLRRREIGLLQTKGFTRTQVLGIFLTQTFLLGILGGLLGVFFGLLLNPLFAQTSLTSAFNPKLVSLYTVVMSVVFGVAIAFFSTYSSARKASKLPTIDALREYLFVEEEKAYRKRWPWLAFILGTYKVVVFSLGINMSSVLSNMMFRTGNFIVSLLLIPLFFVDLVLNFIGPLLFFWGFTKLFIQASLKFQELVTRVAKFMGDLGALATKNVRRNPSRSAKVAFLIALIIGYSVQITGQLASEQDYAVRNVYYNVGADVSVSVSNATAVQEILDLVMANVSAYVQNATTEYSFYAYGAVASQNVQVKAVDPSSWPKTAYYEDAWFSGNSAATAFNSMATNNHTMILDRGVAKVLRLKVGDNVTFTFGGLSERLNVVGFFGLEPSTQQIGIGPVVTSQYWSYIPDQLYEEIDGHVTAYAKILLKLKAGADGKSVAQNIRALDARINTVDSFAESWEQSQKGVFTIENTISMASIDIQKLGVMFAFLAASVGVALVSTISMKERDREAAIMSVRGLSYKQLAIMFLTENLAIVTFSVILGFAVGAVVVNGNLMARNSYSSSLVQYRLVFPLDTVLLLGSCISLIFLMTILPVLIMSRKYVTELERMVRLR